MILKVYTALDKAVNAYLQPFFCRSKGEAIRSFTTAVNDPDHQFHKHAADFSLYELGEWNDAAGIFTCGEPVRVVSALECMDLDNLIPPEKSRNGAGRVAL